MKVSTERSAQGDYINNEGIEARNQGIALLADTIPSQKCKGRAQECRHPPPGQQVEKQCAQTCEQQSEIPCNLSLTDDR